MMPEIYIDLVDQNFVITDQNILFLKTKYAPSSLPSTKIKRRKKKWESQFE